ncbi:nitronate monooxygenase [Alkalibaculum sp. M08DMB]|uniref:Probable nitronate monooxygenase n=1 Tax=Alkalibaculum sporogenes TaxID=2655001 RepID=A0A6A7KAX6_9FIRM|nr:nitronate monooxygenase family protein [Alkalibaculum sporogenes]MPW26699.1 nitronate monooxygenase [Alkalibaculum sporogenes]
MSLPSLKIGDLIAKVPIIQGGMAVGVSLSSLAAAVANEGGIGVISGVQVGFREPDFRTNNMMANIRGLQKEIKKARELSPKGIIGVNIMTAASQYKELIETAVKEKIDIIIAGAGLPKDLPKYVKDSDTKIIPIVSSGKAAKIITKLWTRNYGYVPDAIIVEGAEAGGHLGFSAEELHGNSAPRLIDILKEVIKEINPFEVQYDKKIPVIAAGGIFNGKDIIEYIKNGAAGVQMSTRFVATHECDASIEFKEAYLNAKEEDIELVVSPVGMPGRAIRTKFTDAMKKNKMPITKCYKCLTPCEPKIAPYCISDALINSVKGKIEEGLVFCGSSAFKLSEIVSVKQLMQSIIKEAENAN